MRSDQTLFVRYRDGNNIGAPNLCGFVVNLVGNRASKGVFVTASKFTRDARDYARNVQHRNVLVDSDVLARFMVRYSVGVRGDDRTIVIKTARRELFCRRVNFATSRLKISLGVCLDGHCMACRSGRQLR